jgi:phosphate starvation-inducible protein PhoH
MSRFDLDIVDSIEVSSRKRKVKPVKAKIDNLNVKKVEPITEAQREMFASFMQGQNIVACGSAGTGKTYVATYLALQEVFAQRKNKIVFVRSAVPTRQIGHLPGDLNEKSLVYTTPFKQIVDDLCENGTAYNILTTKGVVEFMTTSFIRGITLDNCIIIFDEFQSSGWHELASVVSRCGKNTQIVFCGDTKQNDLITNKHDVSGLSNFMKVADDMEEFDIVKFYPQDIVRSGLVKSFILACERAGL